MLASCIQLCVLNRNNSLEMIGQCTVNNFVEKIFERKQHVKNEDGITWQYIIKDCIFLNG